MTRTNALGTFLLLPGGGALNGSFSLIVDFLGPLGITGGNEFIFSGVVTGSPDAGALITFLNPSHTFTFDNANATGTFGLTLPSIVAVTTPHTTELIGVVSGAQQTLRPAAVPEPASLLLVVLGIAALGRAPRREARERV